MAIKDKPKKKKGVVRGRSAAFLITVGLHAALLIGAVFYTAMVVLQREEPKFEGTKIARPKMDLKKLQVPVKVKKIRQPKFNMAAPPNAPQMNLNMPTIGKIGGGMDALSGGGLGSLGFSMNFESGLFGGDSGTGNELVGTFYCLRKKANGMPPGGDLTTGTHAYVQTFRKIIKEFIDERWDEEILAEYAHSDEKKFAVSIFMPEVNAADAPDAFGMGDFWRGLDVTDRGGWVVHYKGKFSAPERGTYRFCGQGDAVMIVKVGRDIVLDASWKMLEQYEKDGKLQRMEWSNQRGKMTDWESRDKNSDKYPMGNGTMAIGDWMTLKKGEPMDIDILIGEIAGNRSTFRLLIEKQGEEYDWVSFEGSNPSGGVFIEPGTRPVLPVFKMAAIPPSLEEKMKIDPKVATLDGPVFGSLGR